MKVYIGGYPDNRLSCDIHYKYMVKKYGFDWKENNTRFEKFLEKLEDAIQWIYDHSINHLVKYRKRKIQVRIDRYDTWNMDHTLALIVLPMLKQLKATKHGSPHTDDEDVPEHLRSNPNRIKMSEDDIRVVESWDADDTVHVRWEWIMNEMIYAFEMELDEDWDLRIYQREPKGWDDAKFAERKVIADRIANGFRLFGKYYQGLWD